MLNPRLAYYEAMVCQLSVASRITLYANGEFRCRAISQKLAVMSVDTLYFFTGVSFSVVRRIFLASKRGFFLLLLVILRLLQLATLLK